MGKNQQLGPSNEARPKKRKLTSIKNDSLLEEKEVFVPPPEQLTYLQPRPSCKTTLIRAAKAKGIGKSIEVTKIQNERK